MLVPVLGTVQKYAWGKLGHESTVALLAEANGTEIIDENLPYAELWMGTHQNGPAKVKTLDGHQEIFCSLKEFLASNPAVVSDNVELQAQVAAEGLPFLFKILSVRTALSIQSHPDKKLAERLHFERPDIYKDPNHKPEMACAITNFEVLVGFRQLVEIQFNIEKTPEVLQLLRESCPSGLDEGLEKSDHYDDSENRRRVKILFSALLRSDPACVSKTFSLLKTRLSNAVDSSSTDKLVLRLMDQYPGNVGVFCPYFMCYRNLQPGEAVFLDANEPHAYLFGDCAEIMACSDNVIRAGLTPKLCDIDTLLSTLTYNLGDQDSYTHHPSKLLTGVEANEEGHRKSLYIPPSAFVTEFQMERAEVYPSGEPLRLTPATFVCIIIVSNGNGFAKSEHQEDKRVELKRGNIFLLPANTNICIENTCKSEPLVVFRASIKGSFQ